MSILPKHELGGESLTKQSFKDEANVNTIVNRALRNNTPVGNPNATRQPIFADISSFDHMEMRNKIADVDNAFASLPAKIRAQHSNDPHQLIRWVERPENRAEAQKLGLLPPDVANEPKAPAVPAAAQHAEAKPSSAPAVNPDGGKPVA